MSHLTPRKIPVAIIGGGTIAPFHAKHVQFSPMCELVAIIDPFPPGQDLAARLLVPHFTSVDTLLQTVPAGGMKPEIYIVCVPSALHMEVAMKLLESTSAAGAAPKVVLVEKPLATDSVSGEELLRLAADRGTVIAVGHHRRFHPAIVAAKEAIVAGRVGRVTAISGIWMCKKNDGYFDLGWRRSRAGGGGPVWNNFVHDVDLLHCLVGAHITRVWSTGMVKRRKTHLSDNHNGTSNGSEQEDAVEEGAAIMMHFANGVVGTFLVCDNAPSPYSWEAATGENPLLPQAPAAVDCFRIFGSRGTMTVPDGNLWTYRQQDADERGLEVGWNIPMVREALDVKPGVPFRSQVEHLGRVVLEGETPVCSGTDGLMAVKVCEAIVEALDNEDGFPHDIEQL